MNAKLSVNHWRPLVLLVLSAVMSAWLAPGWAARQEAAASAPVAAPLPGGLTGRTLLQTGEPLRLEVAGAPEASAVQWRLDGRRVGAAATLRLGRVAEGDHALSLTYRDAAGRHYAVTTVVRVVGPEQYPLVVSALQAAIALPLWEEDDPVFLPLVER